MSGEARIAARRRVAPGISAITSYQGGFGRKPGPVLGGHHLVRQ